jgi:ATP-binding cassette subfamily C protein CydCD
LYFDWRLYELTRGVRLRVALAALLGLIAVGAGVARLAISGVVIFRVFQGDAFSTLALPLTAVGALIVVRGLFQYWQNAVSHHAAAAVKIRLRRELYEHCQELGPSRFDRQRTGDVILTLVEGVERLETFFGQYLSQFAVSAVAPVLIFVFMAVLDLQIGLIFLAFAVFTLLVPAAFQRWNRSRGRTRRDAYGAMGADFLDSVQGLSTLKAFGQSKRRGVELARRARDLYRGSMGVEAANGATSGISMLGMAAGAAVALGVGAVRVADGDMELRTLLIVLMLGVEVFRPLRELTQLYHTGVLAISAAESVFKLMDTPVEVHDPGRAGVSSSHETLEPEVAFEDVTFAYDEGRRPAVEGVSFTLRRGETLGVVGASGAGKSTLVWLMLRFYDPQDGRITLGGRNIRELPFNALRDRIAVVTQDTYLFTGTVEENLRFGKPDASNEEVVAAARAANAHGFIMDLPDGYETQVGERAVRLSGGQRQRIAIARALLKDAPILVLDEALSNVDAENEALIQEALDRLMEGRTTLIIAHRLSSIVGADRILVMDAGRQVEVGTHAELVGSGGTYAALMANQQTGDDLVFAPSLPAAGPIEPGEAVAPESRKAPGDTASERLGFLTAWARLLGMIGPARPQMALTFLLGLANHGSTIALGVVSALLVGNVLNGEDLTGLLVLLAVVVPLSALFFFAEGWQSHDMAHRLLAEMRIDLFDKLEPLAPAYMVRRRSGDLVSVVGGDVETIEFFFAHTITPMFVAIIVPGAVLGVLAVLSWPLAVVLAPFLIAVAVSPFYALRRSEGLGEEVRERLGDLHAFMADGIQGMREVSAFGQGRRRAERMTEKGWAYARYQLSFLKSQASQIGFIEAMTGVGGLAVLAMGVWLVVEGQIDRRTLPLATLLAMSSFTPVGELARTMKQLMETLAATRRILAVHDEQVLVHDGRGIPAALEDDGKGAPSVAFDGVAFAYGTGERRALDGVSFDVEPGRTVALVGRSGAGKTTSANLVLRFWDPTGGRLSLAANDLRDFELDALRGSIALVSQDTYLFNTTVRENLRLGRPDATDVEIEEAARQANAHDFIASFPDGYDTNVGERGMQLSGGERQRVSIARALLKNAPVLILDEATSHLDAVSETQVRQALGRLMEGRTTLVIAHRLSTIRDADSIVVLDSGRVVEQGTHAELLERGDLYAQLVSTQLVSSTARPAD